ncbi:WG repeat-containing protein [Flavivirga amylovorans]|uniref:WG repeat-containing protein n=1 Tax=Flavivirga amylovorans TaxID=870486 RepID=A0ABT8WX52_9FLAO|nr:WG repeat-containing protein [Flavivirga amylovorans]MDO5986240.1 WG repeat-containing protein [Flavivirga amylovorans]
MKLNQYEWNPEEDLIAEGAFAEVFKARDSNNENRFVALKIYKEGITKGTSGNTMGSKYTLEKEFRKIDGLSHTNIISFYGLDYITYKDGLGRTSNYPVIIMEYASEGTLLQFLQYQKTPSIIEDLMIQIINGVAYLHKEGTIHRDLKPGNILVSRNRRGEPVAKITDFGISRDIADKNNIEQSTTEGVGTPHYMAPEQFFKKEFGVNGEISEQTDIWGLGVIIYRMLTGALPFGHGVKDYELVRDSITNEDPDLFSIPERYKELIRCCLQKKASDRPNSASLLINKIGVLATLEEEKTIDIANLENFQDKKTMEVPSKNNLNKVKKKKLALPITISIIVILLVITAFFFYNGNNHPSELAVVKLNNKFGYIDKEGNKIFSSKYDAAWGFSEGLGLVKSKGKWGFIDANGNEIIETKYDNALPFAEGLAPVKTKDKWGFINKEGNAKIEAQFDEAGTFAEGLAPVNKNGKWGYINKKNEIIIPLSYKYAYSFSEGLAVVGQNNKEGFVDKNGEIVIPFQYDLALSFSNGLAAVNIKGKWGFIDKKGNIVIKPSYDNTWGFSEGLAPVLFDNKWGFIDKKGIFIISVKYEGASGFSNGLSAVRLNGKEGFINKDDKIVIPFTYDYADTFTKVN